MTARPRAEKSSRIQNPASPSCFAVITACISCVIVVMAPRGTIAQAPDDTTRLVQEYVRIDTAIPPGDTRKAADFLAGVFQRADIPVTRYESAPGKAEVLFDALRDTLAR